jgi:hypothetical protein
VKLLTNLEVSLMFENCLQCSNGFVNFKFVTGKKTFLNNISLTNKYFLKVSQQKTQLSFVGFA